MTYKITAYINHVPVHFAEEYSSPNKAVTAAEIWLRKKISENPENYYYYGYDIIEKPTALRYTGRKMTKGHKVHNR